jgi:rubrerythrin
MTIEQIAEKWRNNYCASGTMSVHEAIESAIREALANLADCRMCGKTWLAGERCPACDNLVTPKGAGK